MFADSKFASGVLKAPKWFCSRQAVKPFRCWRLTGIENLTHYVCTLQQYSDPILTLSALLSSILNQEEILSLHSSKEYLRQIDLSNDLFIIHNFLEIKVPLVLKYLRYLLVCFWRTVSRRLISILQKKDI